MAARGWSSIDMDEDPARYPGELRRVSGQPELARVNRRVVDLLDLRAGLELLDVGCGIGRDARRLRRALGSTGRLVGVDKSRTMLEGCPRGLAGARFVRGSVGRLPFERASFDRCRCERVLQHVDDPARALEEMRRVLRPGGILVLAEPDWGSATLRGAAGVAPRDVRAVLASVARHIDIGRRLAALARRAGLRVTANLEMRPRWTEHRTLVAAWDLRRASAAHARDRGSPPAWLGAVRRASLRRTLRASVTVHVVRAVR